ncbi:hypothetical protein GM418_21640 [Maribellus comscasis]|uniref:Uncharacterized protein n=1 Tax=Maribellus comscasis TaxID=2681766 RepID=A0A6I6K3K5_9BACT|nr:hypothetical protein [Maribellus comscasis]QGY46173.1 hypothetical protein GM418_21640 [Maribellus comscasis]
MDIVIILKILIPFFLYLVLLQFVAKIVYKNMLEKSTKNKVTTESGLAQKKSSVYTSNLTYTDKLEEIPFKRSNQFESLEKRLTIGSTFFRIHFSWTLIITLIFGISIVSHQSNPDSLESIFYDNSSTLQPILILSYSSMIIAIAGGHLYYYIRDNALPILYQIFVVILITLSVFIFSDFIHKPVYILISVGIYLIILSVTILTIKELAHPKDLSINLVILRVFGNYKNMGLIFGRLIKRWKYIGAHYTIVDPSYIKYYYRFWGPKNLTNSLEVIFILTLIFIVYGVFNFFFWDFELIPIQYNTYFEFGLPVLVFTVTLFIVKRNIKRNFLDSAGAIGFKVQKHNSKNPRKNYQYSELPIYCFENIWKPALNELKDVGDVVLMDLRGFSDSNRGCKYEIEFIVDHINIQNVLVLVDNKTKINVFDLFQEKFRNMDNESPNRFLQKPKIKLLDVEKYRTTLFPGLRIIRREIVNNIVNILLYSSLEGSAKEKFIHTEKLYTHQNNLKPPPKNKFKEFFKGSFLGFFIACIINVFLFYSVYPLEYFEKINYFDPHENIFPIILIFSVFGALFSSIPSGFCWVIAKVNRKIVLVGTLLGYVFGFTAFLMTLKEGDLSFSVFNDIFYKAVSMGIAGEITGTLLALVIFKLHFSNTKLVLR